MENSIPAFVEKELVPYLHFPKEDVLQQEEQRKLRHQQLEKAAVLGNGSHTKVSILFEDIHGLKRIDTTIWATTEESIVLKQGVVIPIHRIKAVELV